jgi:hypothetical protein
MIFSIPPTKVVEIFLGWLAIVYFYCVKNIVIKIISFMNISIKKSALLNIYTFLINDQSLLNWLDEWGVGVRYEMDE